MIHRIINLNLLIITSVKKYRHHKKTQQDLYINDNDKETFDKRGDTYSGIPSPDI